jgi:hypothetical protein
MFLVKLLFSLCLAAKATSAAPAASLPTVDLGYEVHQAISFNVRYFVLIHPSGSH